MALLRHADGRDYVRFLEKTGSRGQTDKMTRMTRNGSRAQRRKVSPSIFVWAIPDFDEAGMIRLAC
jgi:hypothetical protein